jgi:hypothetical protein
MTPKEYALELINAVDAKFKTNNFAELKDCALMAVNEYISIAMLGKNNDRMLFWNEIKEEIEKL